MPKTIYKSKVDIWIVALVVCVFLLCVIAGFDAALPTTLGRWIYGVLIVLLGAGFPLWIMLSTRYTLTDEELDVRCGPLSWKVPLREIHNVTPTRSPLSSPALSLDRLQIDYGKYRSIMISPRDREAFLADLWKRHKATRG